MPRHARQVRRAARAGDDDAQAAFVRFAGVLLQILRRAMGRNDLRFAGDAELRAHIGGGFHRRPVGVAAHENSDQGLVSLVFHLPKI